MLQKENRPEATSAFGRFWYQLFRRVDVYAELIKLS
jgi:hypothetical protein